MYYYESYRILQFYSLFCCRDISLVSIQKHSYIVSVVLCSSVQAMEIATKYTGLQQLLSNSIIIRLLKIITIPTGNKENLSSSLCVVQWSPAVTASQITWKAVHGPISTSASFGCVWPPRSLSSSTQAAGSQHRHWAQGPYVPPQLLSQRKLVPSAPWWSDPSVPFLSLPLGDPSPPHSLTQNPKRDDHLYVEVNLQSHLPLLTVELTICSTSQRCCHRFPGRCPCTDMLSCLCFERSEVVDEDRVLLYPSIAGTARLRGLAGEHS